MANAQENIVLVFNEVVQAGSGSFQLWDFYAPDLGNLSKPEFDIPVANIIDASTSSHSLISGRRVSITPKTLCLVGNATECQDIEIGKTYYLTTTGPGAVSDLYNHSLAELNTKSTWTFSASATETKTPEVAFNGGFSFSGMKITGTLFFTEGVTAHSGILAIQDCGPDFDCTATTDNVAAMQDAEITFGDGGVGAEITGSEYGAMKFVKTLPTNNRRYKVTAPAGLVKDSASTKNVGPSAPFSFYVEMGTTRLPTLDTAASFPKSGTKIVKW
jgi:hypothetical protein